MQHVTFEQVSKSYNGATGCMCGCNGTYRLKSADDIAAANKNAGWEAYDDDSVSPRAVKIAVNKVNAAIDEFGDKATPGDHGGKTFRDGDVWFHACDDYVAIDRGGRNTTVYLKGA